MAATENRNAAVLERESRQLSDEVLREVNEILEETAQEQKVPRRYVAYRVPSPGVRYYF